MTHDCKVAEPRAKIEWRNLDAISLGLSLWCRALRIKCSHDFYGEIWRFFWPFQIDLSREFQLALHMPPWHNRRKCIAMCMQLFFLWRDMLTNSQSKGKSDLFDARMRGNAHVLLSIDITCQTFEKSS